MTEHRTYLVHYNEIGLKGRNRARFEEQLIKNIYYGARGLSVESVRRMYGRFRLEQNPDGDAEELHQRLARIYGIAHFDPVRVMGWDMDRLREEVARSAADGSFESFAIRARRLNKEFPKRSLELNIELGTLVQEQTGARVDLDDPERTFHVLVLNKEIFLYHERFPGPGGLPLGVAGRVGILLSGGIDSPVAAERMIRRGCEPLFIHFHSSPFTDRSSIDKAEELARILTRHRTAAEIFLVPLGPLQQKIVAEAPSKLRVILYRRYMLRLAERIARERKCLVLATGESLGQVSSQTLDNLALLDRTITTPILRPLVAWDKQEIVDEAHRIGTFELSTEPHSDCCSFLLPRSPATKARLDDVERAEEELAAEEAMTQALERTERRKVE